MKKQTRTVLWFVLFAGVLSIVVLSLLAPKVVESPVENSEEDVLVQVAGVVIEFMEDAYINKNYVKASSLYVPPQGFETHLSIEPMSLVDYIEWYVRSVDLKSLGAVTHVQIQEVEILTRDEQGLEGLSEEMYKVTFHFMKEDGEPIYFGPCCGDEGPPSPEMVTRVKKTENEYRVYEDLPYRP